MEELEVFQKFDEIAVVTQYGDLFGGDKEKAKQIAAHKAWLQSIRHERPSTSHPFKIGVYIRYFNQTKYDNYLAYHKKQFSDSIGLCPKWELIDFYIDNGASTPYMENAPEWSRLLQDCMHIAYFQRIPSFVRCCPKFLHHSFVPYGIIEYNVFEQIEMC